MRTIARLLVIAVAACFACGVYLYLTLPDVRRLRAENPGITAFQRLRAGEARSRGRQPRHVQRWVSYGRISPHLRRAVLVAEDSRFWQHDGVDYEQLRASIEVNIERREFARGASTITQQLAKNLYLSPAKNPVRKLRELLIARRLEAELSKQRILELYLNVIEWGDGVYGAEAAARTYFGKAAAQLGPHESALLAAALVNPRLLDPAHPSARLRRRQRMIATRMGSPLAPREKDAISKPLVAEPVAGVPRLAPSDAAPVLPGSPVMPSSSSDDQKCDIHPCR